MSTPSHTPGSVARRARTTIEGVAFWLAVSLAGAYPFLLLGLDRGLVDHRIFGAVLLTHLIAFVLGHSYHRPAE